MKKLLLFSVALLLSAYCMAQEELAFPFQGGSAIMNRFFKDSLTVSPDIITQKAMGMAIFKFTADEKGTISKIVVYYADDLVLTPPLIAALKKSNHKWVIPGNEKFHDFIIPFSINLTPPVTGNSKAPNTYFNFFMHNNRVVSTDQIPLNSATLLPTVVVQYNLPQ